MVCYSNEMLLKTYQTKLESFQLKSDEDKGDGRGEKVVKFMQILILYSRATRSLQAFLYI